MIDFVFTSKFKRDLAKINQEVFFSEGWIEVIYCLKNGKTMSAARKDHPLHGELKHCRDCHIKGDLVLIYERQKDCIIFHQIGSHSELGIMKKGKNR